MYTSYGEQSAIILICSEK